MESECQVLVHLLPQHIAHIVQMQRSELLFPALSHTHIDRIFCQLMLIQVLFGYETCNVQVVFYVAGSYLTPEKR